METRICSWNVSTFTSMRRLEDATCHVQSSWIWSLERWIPCVLVHLDSSFVQITLSLVKQVRYIIILVFSEFSCLDL